MYPKGSHILAPLTKLTDVKGVIKWMPKCPKAFDQIKALLAKEAFLRYPDHNKPFHIYADASDLQLSPAIFQNNAPITFYSHKLNATQRNYTGGRKELLLVIRTLKEFRTMLYDCPNIHVYTDHKNNTFHCLQSQHVLCWHLFLEDFGVQFHYIKGQTNFLTDALSCLLFAERQHLIDAQLPVEAAPPDPLQNFYTMVIDNDDLLDCFVHIPASKSIPFVLNYNTIRNAQARDARLQQLRQQHLTQYVNQLLAPDVHVTCYIPKPNQPWKIYLPSELLDSAI